MTLIIRNKPPINRVKDSGNPKPESREHMPRWTAWRDETISRLKEDKAAGAEDSRKAARS